MSRWGTPLGRWVLAVWLTVLVALGVSWPAEAWAGGISYSTLDLSTVRIFTVSGVGKADAKYVATGSVYTLGVPLAGHGSGLRVSADGLILTARHVVEGARQVVVKAPGAKFAVPARVIYMDDRQDFAFLSVAGTSKDFVPLPASTPGLRVRQTVFAVGYPMDPSAKSPQSTRGVVSGTVEGGEYSLGISVNPGNSGGPLVDEHENLLGVVVARGSLEKGVQGIGYAVGLDRVLTVVAPIQVRHQRAKGILDAMPESARATARVIGSLVEGAGIYKMLDDAKRALTHLELSAFSKELSEGVAKGTVDADVVALACAYHWNAAVIRRILQTEGWQTELVAGERDCRKAAQMDPYISSRSPFVRFVNKDSTDSSARPTDAGMQAVPRTAQAPNGAAGFTFGSSAKAATEACTKANLKMTGVKKEGLRCSGAAMPVGYPAVSRVKFCGDIVCRIEVLQKLSGDDATAFLQDYEARHKELESLYGAPNRHVEKLAPDCGESMSWCLSNKKAELADEWVWWGEGDNASIQLRLERVDGRGLIRTVYEHR